MIKTKMTIPVRVLGVIGTLVLVISLYLPWATIQGKELLDASGTFSAMELVKGEESQILGYFFMGVYFILILALFCLIYSLVGRPTTGLGVTMFITVGTYLSMLIIMGSLFQGVMPGNIKLPGIGELDLNDTDEDGLLDQFEEMFGTDMNISDTDGDGLTDGEEVLDPPNGKYSDPTKMDSDGDGIPDKQDDTPLGGMNEQMGNEDKGDDDGEGEDIGEMIDQVNELNEKIGMVTNTTVKAESGVYITTGSCVFMVIIGILLKIDRRKRKNLMIELKYHKKDLNAYKMAIEQALLDGHISEDELGMLNVQRNIMGVSPDEHYTLVISMAEGRKASEESVENLLSILDESFKYKGDGIFGKKRRPPRRGPPPRRGRAGRRRPPRDYDRAGPREEYDDHDEQFEEETEKTDENGTEPGGDEWDF